MNRILLSWVISVMGCAALKVELPGINLDTQNVPQAERKSRGGTKPEMLVDCSNVTLPENTRLSAEFMRDQAVVDKIYQNWQRWESGDVITEPEIITLYNQARTLFPTMASTYAKEYCAGRNENRAVGRLEEQLINAQKILKHFESVLAENAQSAPKNCIAKLDDAKTLLAKYESELTVFHNGRAIDAKDSDMGDILTQADLQWQIISAAQGVNTPSAISCQEKVTAFRGTISSTKKRLIEANIDRTELPKDLYVGKDKAKLKAIYRKHYESYSDKKVLAVFLVDRDWNRNAGSEWLGNRLVQYDQGFVSGDLLVQADSKNAEIIRLTPRKDWLDGGKIKFDVYVPQSRGMIRIAKLHEARRK